MNLNFDASGHQPQSFDLLPADWYTVVLTEGEEKPTSKNNGTTNTDTYYSATFEIVGGKYNGRKLFHNFNFNNSNEDAKRIAFDQLASICHAVGILKVDSMNVLFNKPMQAKVKVRAAVMEEDGVTEKYEARNEIKGFKAVEGAAPAGSVAGAGGLPAGFTAGTQATPAPAAASPATPAAAAATPAIPATPSIPATPVAAPVKKLVMTEKAQGATPEQFRAADPAWTDQLLVDQGYAQWVEEAPALATPAVPVAPAPAAAPAAPAAEGDDTPPWLKAQ